MSDESTLPPVKEPNTSRVFLKRIGAWAKEHPGISIPLAAYLAGIATPIVLKWLF